MMKEPRHPSQYDFQSYNQLCQSFKKRKGKKQLFVGKKTKKRTKVEHSSVDSVTTELVTMTKVQSLFFLPFLNYISYMNCISCNSKKRGSSSPYPFYPTGLYLQHKHSIGQVQYRAFWQVPINSRRCSNPGPISLAGSFLLAYLYLTSSLQD